MKNRKGIVLAGGSGTRLYPITNSISKQLLPVYDKPMIYYPITTLMLAGIKDILIISTPSDLGLFKNMLGDGSQWGVNFSYESQASPDGIAQALIIAENFLNNESSALVLGDNIFFGASMPERLDAASNFQEGAKVFAYHVNDPDRYGVVEFNNENKVLSLEEKPKSPKSNYVVTGLYFYDSEASEVAKSLKPSSRGELEITDVNNWYLENKTLEVELLDHGFAWLDTGTHESLHEAGSFIETIQKRQGLMVACPEEIAYKKKWINADSLESLAQPLLKSSYGKYLLSLLN
ncbi:MAG: glucose-1-phosphate thymidylyltransferase [Gammaproteobacteria bacterium]|nr:glucose-1-phosphate thymidylyltransferase [Gammaproteobacteria bacterium]